MENLLMEIDDYAFEKKWLISLFNCEDDNNDDVVYSYSKDGNKYKIYVYVKSLNEVEIKGYYNNYCIFDEIVISFEKFKEILQENNF